MRAIKETSFADVTTIESISSLIGYVARRIRLDDRILWFRGHSAAKWNLEPAIRRSYDSAAERDFTNRFRSRAGTRYQKLPEYDNIAAWLSLMQHYGLPTRLLDWTRSPLVALYFALESYIYEPATQPQDACIWVLEPHILNKIELRESVTPSIDAHMCRSLLRPAFYHRGKENHKVAAVMAAESDLRMFVQQGCFTIHSFSKPLETHKHGSKFLTKLLIPSQCVRALAFEVDVCGFRKGDIFPDLQHLADELKHRYHHRG